MIDPTKFPILQTKNLKLEGIEMIEGHIIIRFIAAHNPAFNEPIIMDIVTDLTKVTFRYAILDKSTNTVRKYLGQAGDPEVDDYVIEGV